ncbi:hypothetical protein [Clostridium sp. C2-6-12]|uniref:hypothetical protein n=1 Tax=Clostridium sp. C2-6-12 TaxID=2698832 RepID=UPI001371B278|nr:hypothetical protein [Clostridium sp. C2-6-12]
MDKKALAKHINIATFILMLGVLVKVVAITDIGELRLSCILCIFMILIGLLNDIWDSKGKNNGKEIL